MFLGKSVLLLVEDKKGSLLGQSCVEKVLGKKRGKETQNQMKIRQNRTKPTSPQNQPAGHNNQNQIVVVQLCEVAACISIFHAHTGQCISSVSLVLENEFNPDGSFPLAEVVLYERCQFIWCNSLFDVF